MWNPVRSPSPKPAGCSKVFHAEIKADPVRWLRDLVNHRRWEAVSGELAECPTCSSTLLLLDAGAEDAQVAA